MMGAMAAVLVSQSSIEQQTVQTTAASMFLLTLIVPIVSIALIAFSLTKYSSKISPSELLYFRFIEHIFRKKI
jgi:hypothetical protein